jgi:uncharacterized protein YhfF
MKFSHEILDFWEKVKMETGIEGTFTDAYGIGDTPWLKQELLNLVLDGKKRASTSLVKESELEGWPEPEVGQYNIILDGSDKPAAVIKTVSIRRCRFSDVDEDHAYLEGEDDRTIESYIREHTKYYMRRGKVLGFEFTPDMGVVLDRFELVYPLYIECLRLDGFPDALELL